MNHEIYDVASVFEIFFVTCKAWQLLRHALLYGSNLVIIAKNQYFRLGFRVGKA